MLQRPNGVPFTTGRSSYLDHIEGHPHNRICVSVRFAQLPRTLAVIDTGASWCVLSKEQAEVEDSNYRQTATEAIELVIRRDQVSGVLVRWPVTLCAEEGDDLIIESTIFIPDDDLPLPNFIGLDGLLNRINFAVDPQKRHFFFGVEP